MKQSGLGVSLSIGLLFGTAAAVGCVDPVGDLFQSGGSGGQASTTASTSTTTADVQPTTSVTATTTTTTDTSSSIASTSEATASVASSSTGTPGPTVDCGVFGACPVNNNSACCYDPDQQTSSCGPPGDCKPSDNAEPTVITCETGADCPGQICCGQRYNAGDTSSPYQSATCQSTCTYPDLHLCDPNAPDCPTYKDGQGNTYPTTCSPSTLLPKGYYVCKLAQ